MANYFVIGYEFEEFQVGLHAFQVRAADNATPVELLTFACALDAAPYESCASPVGLTELGMGAHTFLVRANDLAGNADPTPATYTWTIQAPPACTAGTVTLTASADAWVDQNSSSNNFGADATLKVQAKSGDNFRALVRFTMPTVVPAGCQIATATLRLNAGSATGGRTLQAIRLASSWPENAVTWNNVGRSLCAWGVGGAGQNGGRARGGAVPGRLRGVPPGGARATPLR